MAFELSGDARRHQLCPRWASQGHVAACESHGGGLWRVVSISHANRIDQATGYGNVKKSGNC